MLRSKLIHGNSWWRHQMDTFSALLARCAGNSPVPHKGKWRGALMFSLIYAWINDWVNNREAGGHCDVNVMLKGPQTYLASIPDDWFAVSHVIVDKVPSFTRWHPRKWYMDGFSWQLWPKPYFHLGI